MQLAAIVALVNEFVPRELGTKCLKLIELSHQRHGFDGFGKRIASRESRVALTVIPGMFQVMEAASSAYKLRMVCWILGLAIVAISWLTSWWLLLSLLVVAVSVRMLIKSERQLLEFSAAILLGLEMLADGFAGWGIKYPDAQARARLIFGEAPSHQWLDYYLPRRANLTPEDLRRFGPRAN